MNRAGIAAAIIFVLLIGVGQFDGGTETIYLGGTKCRDGWVSSSTGRGTCSWHGGVQGPNVRIVPYDGPLPDSIAPALSWLFYGALALSAVEAYATGNKRQRLSPGSSEDKDNESDQQAPNTSERDSESGEPAPPTQNEIQQQENLADLHLASGRYSDAIPILEQLANHYSDERDSWNAASAWNRLASARESALGLTHHDTATAVDQFAFWSMDRYYFDEAIEALTRLADEHESDSGPDDRRTLEAKDRLASAYDKRSINEYHKGEAPQWRETAISIWESVTTATEHVLPANDALSLDIHRKLASAYGRTERTHESIEILERIMPAHSEVVGPTALDTLSGWDELARQYLDANRPEDGLRVRNNLVDLCERELGTRHYLTEREKRSLASFKRRINIRMQGTSPSS